MAYLAYEKKKVHRCDVAVGSALLESAHGENTSSYVCTSVRSCVQCHSLNIVQCPPPKHVHAPSPHGRIMWSVVQVSLIAELEYGTERWNGKWNGTVNIHSCS